MPQTSTQTSKPILPQFSSKLSFVFAKSSPTQQNAIKHEENKINLNTSKLIKM